MADLVNWDTMEFTVSVISLLSSTWAFSDIFTDPSSCIYKACIGVERLHIITRTRVRAYYILR